MRSDSKISLLAKSVLLAMRVKTLLIMVLPVERLSSSIPFWPKIEAPFLCEST